LDTIFEFCDLSIALDRTMTWARSLHGYTARTMALCSAMLALIFGVLSWYFDIDSTHEWVSKGASGLAQAGQLADYAQITLILITIAPTLLRQTLAGVARQGLKVASFAFFAVGIFDLQTDWPRVKVFCDAMYPLFAPFGVLQGPVWYISRLVFAIVATDGFELLTVCCAVATVVLLRDKASRGVTP
jgi:hypothetical protein